MLPSSLAAAVAGTVLTCLAGCGIFGNLMVVLVVLKAPRMRAVGYILIANLAVADALQSFNMFFVVITVFKGGQWQFGHTTCQVHAFLTTEFVLTTMLSLAVISINRYVRVVRADKYKTIFCPRNLKLLIAFTWLAPLAYATPPLLGWSKYSYIPGKCTCMFRFAFSHSFAFFLVGTITAPVMVVMVLCYLRIFWIVRSHKRRVGLEESAGQTKRNTASDESQITANIAVVVVSHIICFIPATVVNIIEIFYQAYAIPFWLDFISFSLIYVSHANNPIVYGLMNKQYRNSLVYIHRHIRWNTHRTDRRNNADRGLGATPHLEGNNHTVEPRRAFPAISNLAH